MDHFCRYAGLFRHAVYKGIHHGHGLLHGILHRRLLNASGFDTLHLPFFGRGLTGLLFVNVPTGAGAVVIAVTNSSVHIMLFP